MNYIATLDTPTTNEQARRTQGRQDQFNDSKNAAVPRVTSFDRRNKNTFLTFIVTADLAIVDGCDGIFNLTPDTSPVYVESMTVQCVFQSEIDRIRRAVYEIELDGKTTKYVTLCKPESSQVTLLRISRIDKNHASHSGRRFFQIQLLDWSRRTDVPYALLRDVFSLSKAEAKVANAIGNGETIGAFATRNFVSKFTVQTQLKAAFRKTGVSRQPELARLMTQLSLLSGNASPQH